MSEQRKTLYKATFNCASSFETIVKKCSACFALGQRQRNNMSNNFKVTAVKRTEKSLATKLYQVFSKHRVYLLLSSLIPPLLSMAWVCRTVAQTAVVPLAVVRKKRREKTVFKKYRPNALAPPTLPRPTTQMIGSRLFLLLSPAPASVAASPQLRWCNHLNRSSDAAHGPFPDTNYQQTSEKF